MQYVTRQDKDRVAWLTMTQPDSLNALSDGMIGALQDTLDSIADDQTISVVVIAGDGRAFCAGHDLREMQAARQSPDKGAIALADLFARCTKLMLRIQSLPQPVIAQVHGLAAAAGCQLVATCDLAVAQEDTKFGVNGINIGLFCSTPMVALTRVIPRKQAFELLTTGRFASASEAVALGLVNRTAPSGDLQQTTQTLAQTLASKRAGVVKIGKQAFYAQSELGVEDAYALTGKVMVENMSYDDTAEGIAAFLDKRPPNWTP